MKQATVFIATGFLSIATVRADYISYYLVHTGVENTLKENGRQKNIKNKQATVTGLESANTESTGKWKDRYRRIKGRLNSLGLLLDGFFMTSEAYPTLQRIIRTQGQIYEECRGNTALMRMAAESEVVFVDRAQMLIRFLVGLAMAYGDINQMKPGDRKMLLNHAIDQLNGLDTNASTLLGNIRNYKHSQALKERRGFRDWINRDKQIINEIIKNAKELG